MNTHENSPKIDITTFFLSISSAVYMGLGLVPNPMSDKPGDNAVDLSLAKQNIDLLELMKDKTVGNLTIEEQKLLEHLLFETRMRFVEVSKSEKMK